MRTFKCTFLECSHPAVLHQQKASLEQKLEIVLLSQSPDETAGGKLVMPSSLLPLQRALEEIGCSFPVVSYTKPNNNTHLGFSSKKTRPLFSKSLSSYVVLHGIV